MGAGWVMQGAAKSNLSFPNPKSRQETFRGCRWVLPQKMMPVATMHRERGCIQPLGRGGRRSAVVWGSRVFLFRYKAMSLWVVAALVLVASHAPAGAQDPDFDCGWRRAAYRYALHLQPWRAPFDDVHSALGLAACAVPLAPGPARAPPREALTQSTGVVVYVDPVDGVDGGNGSLASPVRTLSTALRLAQAQRGGNAHVRATVILRAGTHYVPETLNLSPAESNITFAAFGSESPVVSGGHLLQPRWRPHDTAQGRNVWVADVGAQLPPGPALEGLLVGGARAVRARYPNANPERDLRPKGWVPAAAAWLPAAPPARNATYVRVVAPDRPSGEAWGHFVEGVGGPCAVFTPPRAFWCCSFCGNRTVPVALRYNRTLLPRAPYGAGAAGAVVHAMHPSHWSSWQFRVESEDAAAQILRWTYGGFQDARGGTTGAEWYIENVLAELDAPNEYYYERATGRLYYYHNGTGAPPQGLRFEALRNRVLVRVAGARDRPVSGVHFRGLTFTAAAATFLDPHGAPSGGDWALPRTAALVLEGTQDCVIAQCTFTRLDGTALLLSGYNRRALVERNEFAWLGASAIVAWGDAEEVDGTGGTQPRGSRVVGNVMREIGIYVKQSSCWFQAVACQTELRGNVCFNGPRAGVNINDGFGGANEIHRNLVFNMCRETKDHGVINVWDRQPYLTDVRGELSTNPASTDVHHNFLVANYLADMAIDTDDGASYYRLHDNVHLFGGHKSDFAGHDKRSYNSLYAFAKVYYPVCLALYSTPLPGHSEAYYNNTCILPRSLPLVYGFANGCVPGDPSLLHVEMHGNTIYAYNTSAVFFSCGSVHYGLQEWQALGYDSGTEVREGPPSTGQIVDWMARMLEF